METKRSIKSVVAVFLGVALGGLLLTLGAVEPTEVDAAPAAIVQGPRVAEAGPARGPPASARSSAAYSPAWLVDLDFFSSVRTWLRL